MVYKGGRFVTFDIDPYPVDDLATSKLEAALGTPSSQYTSPGVQIGSPREGGGAKDGLADSLGSGIGDALGKGVGDWLMDKGDATANASAAAKPMGETGPTYGALTGAGSRPETTIAAENSIQGSLGQQVQMADPALQGLPADQIPGQSFMSTYQDPLLPSSGSYGGATAAPSAVTPAASAAAPATSAVAPAATSAIAPAAASAVAPAATGAAASGVGALGAGAAGAGAGAATGAAAGTAALGAGAATAGTAAAVGGTAAAVGGTAAVAGGTAAAAGGISAAIPALAALAL